MPIIVFFPSEEEWKKLEEELGKKMLQKLGVNPKELELNPLSTHCKLILGIKDEHEKPKPPSPESKYCRHPAERMRWIACEAWRLIFAGEAKTWKEAWHKAWGEWREACML